MKTLRRRPPVPRARSQAGFLILEVLVAILIFAIGVLSIVGLQVASVKQSSEAKFRADASMLANELIGRMWVSERDVVTLQNRFAGDNPDAPAAEYQRWLDRVAAVLPGIEANPPRVTVEAVPAGVPGVDPSSLVTIVVQWKAPNEPPADPVHNFTVVTQIR